ncbi:MAG: GDSL-type esterase/lipase family protein [Isosphaeraceae bacterium]|nr:GDSL-type esterase/lipase family protein [Isosphaeraceae bacterium]
MSPYIHAASILLLILSHASASAQDAQGIGVMGDSFSDEYQFYPPDRTAGRNWVEILAATRHLNFGRFSASARPEPRNQGYEFNWARSNATTGELLAQGQHTGLAAQVAAGHVSIVVAFIGGNDFIGALRSPDPCGTVASREEQARENVTRALTTILRASPHVRLLVGTVPELRDMPEFREAVATGKISRESMDAVADAIRRYNAYLRAFAAREKRVAIIDLYLVTRLGRSLSGRYVNAGGRALDRFHSGNDDEHFFLADGRHVGTIGQGMLAKLIVDTFNDRFRTGIPPLTIHEIVDFARSLPASRPEGPPACRPSRCRSAGNGIRRARGVRPLSRRAFHGKFGLDRSYTRSAARPA